MSRFRKLLLAVALVLPVSVTSASALNPFAAEYDVELSGLSGVMSSSLSQQDNGSYVFENRTRARGMARMLRPRDVVDRSEFVVTDGELRPLRYLSEDGSRRNKGGSTIEFDWDQANAASQYEGERREVALDRALLDRQLMQIAMMRELAAGQRAGSYSVIDRHHVKEYQVEVQGEEQVSVPAGDFATVRVLRRRPGSSRSTLLWCAADLDYLPVRMQQMKDDKVIATLTLKSVQ